MVNSQLEQFCALFPTEMVLQEVLVELFGKLDGVSGVRRLQGPNERGKDLIFYHQNPFGSKRLNACVVKNASITGNVASSSGARTVLFQAQQAFDSPYTAPTGEEERVEHVYIISPYACTADAIESVKGGLTQRSGQFTFLCGSDLLDIFKLSWPSFLAFEGDFLGRYLNDLRLSLDADPNLSALTLRHSIISPATRLLSAVYVPQTLAVQLVDVYPRPLSWYKDLFSTAVGLGEVHDAAFNLSILASVLTHADLWLSSAVDLAKWAHAGQVLQRVSKELPGLWKEAYRTLERSTVGSRKHDTLPSEALVNLPLPATPEIADDYALAIDVAKRCWSCFREALRDSGTRAHDLPKDPTAVLLHPEYPAHCALAEAAKRSSLAIATTAVIKNHAISESAFSELSASLLITAPAGYGKTSFCKYHALRDAERLLRGEADILPIYVPLHQIATTPGDTFRDIFLRTEHLRQVVESRQSDTLPFRRIRLYLDGLDEIISAKRRQLILELALSEPLAWPVQVIITARDHVYAPYLTALPRVSLNPLGNTGITQLIHQWLDTDPQGIAEVELALAHHKALRELMAIPLLGTLIIGVYRNSRRIPATKVDLYDMFIELLCGGWDLVKNVKRDSRFEPKTKMLVLKKLAGYMHARRLRHAKLQDVQEAFVYSLNRLDTVVGEFVDELLQDGLIVRSGQLLLFSHLSFQEFLAAQDIAEPSGRTQTSALKLFLLGDDWWKEVLAFYIGVTRDPWSTHQWLKHTATHIVRAARNVVEAEVKGRCQVLETVLRTTYPEFSAPSVFGSSRRAI